MGKYYLNNKKLKGAGVSIEYTKSQIDEYIKCAKDPLYFCRTYVRIVNVDLGLIKFNTYDYQAKMIEAFHKKRFVISKLPRQSGKLLPLDQQIPTPSGWRDMGSLQVGDQVFDEFGKPCNVVYVSEPEHVDMYRITFDDGSTIDCCKDHQWTVHDRLNTSRIFKDGKMVSNSHRIITDTIENLYRSHWYRINARGYKEFAYYIPNTKPISYSSKFVKIDPYILGIWLGDGTSRNRDLTCHVDHIQHYEQQGVRFGKQRVYKSAPQVYTAPIDNITTQDLRYYNLLQTCIEKKTKHIPNEYLTNDVPTRIALLQGLMDTDGFVSPKGECSIQLSLKNPKLLDDVYELICSLGIKVKKKVFPKTNSLRLSFTVGRDQIEVFRLPYKRARQKQTLPQARYVYSRTIQNIEPLADKATGVCIQVDSPNSLYLCSKSYIPTHNTTCFVGFFLHYILFNDNVKCAILANKGSLARDILGRIKMAFEHLPDWLQQGVITWNKGDIALENGSKIIAASTSSSAIRGESFNVVLLDEFAFVPNNLAEEFFDSVYPTISSGKTTKVFIVSTPKGLNKFHKIWSEAIEGRNLYHPIEVGWNEVPGRDEKWRLETIANIGLESFEQEFNCVFQGSSKALISSSKLKTLIAKTPTFSNDQGLRIYKDPLYAIGPNHRPVPLGEYVVIVDTSRGVGEDYSAFSVIRIDQQPYEQVASFRSNSISPLQYPDVIHKIANLYHHAHVLVEINDIGGQVVDILREDLEYENILCVQRGKVKGAKTTLSLEGQFGIRTDGQVKRIGCSNLKLLVERDQLIINDQATIDELCNFIKKGASYAADDGFNDDMVMGLVLFGWMTTQKMFKELSDSDIRKTLENQSTQIEDHSALPFGYITNGVDDEEMPEVDQYGTVWFPAS